MMRISRITVAKKRPIIVVFGSFRRNLSSRPRSLLRSWLPRHSRDRRLYQRMYKKVSHYSPYIPLSSKSFLQSMSCTQRIRAVSCCYNSEKGADLWYTPYFHASPSRFTLSFGLELRFSSRPKLRIVHNRLNCLDSFFLLRESREGVSSFVAQYSLPVGQGLKTCSICQSRSPRA